MNITDTLQLHNLDKMQWLFYMWIYLKNMIDQI